MEEFLSLKSDAAEKEYQQWLESHRDGWVINLNRGKKGKYTLHRAHCHTISYNIKEKEQSKRYGKLCFDNLEELTAWQSDNPETADLNPHKCYKC